ncbi:hypothetical protein [Candidatus Kuenenia stuttgartiensis]|uniref:hypothetical protein n=1 Tax=Kuenenia stuttgartiensis TaxID=174633 RepID=UPI00146A7559|nr:hypothetical protein [Candidatus Kuenenia stuttgartiensis]
MSSGLVYPPGCYAEFDELVTMCNRVKDMADSMPPIYEMKAMTWKMPLLKR